MSDIVETSDVALARSALTAAGARDPARLRELLAPDVVVEWPYGGRTPLRFEGIDAALEAFSMADSFVTFSLDVDALYAAGPGIVIAEAHSRGTLADGRRDYENRYVFVLRMAGGRITFWREYFNPIEGNRIFGKGG